MKIKLRDNRLIANSDLIQLKKAKRIVVLGCPGGGKSWLAGKLADILNLPPIHLDAHFWKPGWVMPTDEEWVAIVTDLTAKESWVIDGNYRSTLAMRLERADWVFMMDFPRWFSFYRIFRRRVQYHGKSRPCMTEGCREKLDFAFLSWTWGYKKKRRDSAFQMVSDHGMDKKLTVLSSTHDVNELIAMLKQEQL